MELMTINVFITGVVMSIIFSVIGVFWNDLINTWPVLDYIGKWFDMIDQANDEKKREGKEGIARAISRAKSVIIKVLGWCPKCFSFWLSVGVCALLVLGLKISVMFALFVVSLTYILSRFYIKSLL